MRGESSREFSNLADPRVREALFCIFERPCIRIRNLAPLCQIPRSSLQRKLVNLDYVVVLPGGGFSLNEMAVDVPLFSALERESYYRILLGCKKPVSAEMLYLLTGRNRNSLHGTLKRLEGNGLVVREVDGYRLNPGLERRYRQLLRQLPASVDLLDRLLARERIEHTITRNEEIIVECFGRKRKLQPYRRLRELIEL
ncbi:MAG: hypothetical protein N3F63_01980 [Thermoplasmata archaeon]|nr:hypothetical protein [Thermoplasmata archaeon]